MFSKLIDVQPTLATYLNDDKSLCQTETKAEDSARVDICIQRFIEKKIGARKTYLVFWVIMGELYSRNDITLVVGPGY